MTIQRLLSKLSTRWHRGNAARKQTEKARRRRLLVEHLEDRKLLAAVHPLPLSSLNGTNGFRLDGVAAADFSGYSVSSAGDVNGDGFDDLIVGAWAADPNGIDRAGSIYVVFGKSGGFASTTNFSTLDGTNGFRLDGVAAVDQTGGSVSSAGDVNGDGFDDLIVGANGADNNGSFSGSSYVVFGKSGGFASTINLSTLNGTTGFRLDGVAEGDEQGWSVSGAGDVNGDGFDDLIVGAHNADPNGDSSGSSYIVFGKSGGFASTINLSTLDGMNGFRLDGVAAGDNSGVSVSSAGDVNGDGFADLIVLAWAANPNGNEPGSSYVVFGKSDGFEAATNLSTLNGTDGFRLDGIATDDNAIRRLSSAGDLNGDGFDDLIVGARLANPNGNGSGSSYVVFGKSGAFSPTISLSTLNGTTGFRLDGVAAGDGSGFSVSSAGDVNGDGFDDLIVSAPGADPNGSLSGSSYVVFGKSVGFSPAINLTTLNGTNGFRLDGVGASDYSGWSVSGAGDVNGDGFDDLIAGARFADPNGINSSGSSYVVFGGNFNGGAETQVGGGGNNTLSANQGSSAIDILIGGRGNDTLISDGGSDVLIGGQGNDTLVIPDVNFSGRRRLLGGNGLDTLRLDGLAQTLDLTKIADNRIVDIETIDLGTGRNHVLKLTAREVRNLSSHSNILTINGSGSQVRFLDGDWSGPTLVDGNLYRQYTNGSATVKIRTTLTEDVAVVHPLPLSSLNGTNGFRLDGVAGNDFSGWSVSSAGDVNGDGFDDLIVGAWGADNNGSNSGSSYVVFGKSGGFATPINLSTLDGITGFRLDGAEAVDRFGLSVSSGGDVNGDGFDDLIIGAHYADPNGIDRAGSSYILFGKSGGFTSTVNLSTLDGSSGFRLDGVAVAFRSGSSVRSAGDVNGDGFGDLIVGAYSANHNGNGSGSSYVVFGKSGGFVSSINLSTLDGTNGFRLDGVAAGDNSGVSVSSAGDVNGDGLDDLIVGAWAADPNGSYSGASYVVFGKSGGLVATINLSTLNGTNGFRLDGVAASDSSGVSVSGAGDVNGDGFDDLIVGARGADPGSNGEGSSFVIFGKSGGFTATLNFSALDGTNGFRLEGVAENDFSGSSVSSAGDVNGDGFDDLIVGAWAADPNGIDRAGSSYVVFGKSGGFAASINLSALNGTNGFRLDGVVVVDFSGFSVSSAGDVNGDGFDDLIVGAPYADSNINSAIGSSYVVFGGNFTGGAETQVGGGGNNTLSANQGSSAIDILIGGRGNDTLISDGGSDVLIGGQGNDTLVIPDVNFSGRRRLLGGNGVDTLRLDGLAQTLDLTKIANNRIVDIETIDLGTGTNHVLKLTAREVRNLSSHSNTLTIDGSGSQVRFLDGDWSGPELVDGNTYRQYTNGSATVKIQTTLTEGVEIPLGSLNGSNGFRIDGITPYDFSGFSVSSAGDVNGDGFDDLVIGAWASDANGGDSGQSYVVFGKSGGFTSALDLSSLDGSNGFRLDAIDAGDHLGNAVSSAGDVNGDGFDDLIIGARSADAGDSQSGESYVVFGKSGGFASNLKLTSLDGSNGFRLDGNRGEDYSGWSVSGAGDINGDGSDDLIIGAVYGDAGGAQSGESYVVFGSTAGFASSISLSALNGTNGFRLEGVTQSDISGASVRDAGDVNGDGFDDLIIGAWGTDHNGSNSGSSYVLFGKSDGFASSLSLSILNGSNGFRLDGVDTGDLSGWSVSGAGDINGDGFDDIIVGARDGEVFSNGASYVVFGKSGGFAASMSLSALDGSSGFRLVGNNPNDRAGISVSGAGDVNGDGFDDLVIGASGADASASSIDSGEAYVMFGKSGGFGSIVALSSLNGNSGFRLGGNDADDRSGRSVSGAGDVNGDGFDDLIIGAYYGDAGGSNSGESYVVFGRNFTGGAETQVGDDGNNTLFANQGGVVDILIGGRGNDTLISDGGSDVLIGGQGNDTLVILNVDFSGQRRLSGGNGFDTLLLQGSGHTLDLTGIRDNRIKDIEQIDITGAGINTLTLTVREVLNLSTHSNTLIVRRDTGDVVNRGPGWTQQANEVIGLDTFEVYTQGAATLKVQQVSVPASIVASHVYHFGSSFDLPGNLANALDTGKQLAKEGPAAQLLTYNNLINSSRGINGLVFDIANLPGTPTASDFTFQMSPTGAFDAGANPVGSWVSAPAPSSVSVISGSPSRVVITWPNNAIANRWLRITVNANANTGLAVPEVYYVGHLLGETTGPSGSVFTVAFADITPIRSAVGNTVNASSIVDIDKNGTVSFADISAMRPSVGAQLTIITIPASGGGGGGGGGGMASALPGGGGLGSGVANERGGAAYELNSANLPSLRSGLLDQQVHEELLQATAFKATSPQATKAARDWVFGGIGANSVRKPSANSDLRMPPDALNLELESILEEIG